MEQLFKQQKVSGLDLVADRIGLSYKAAIAVCLSVFTLILALQQICSTFWAQIASEFAGALIFLGIFSLLIRARRRSEALHDFNRRQLETIVEGAPIGVGILDLERKVVYCNSAFARTYGFHQSEILGVTLPIPDSQKQPWAELVDRLRKGESFVDVPALRERKDGTRFYANISGAPLGDNSRPPFGLVALISAAKDNLDGPLEHRSIEMLVQSAFDFMCVADLRGRTLFVNEAGIRMNGMRGDEVEGTSLLEFFAGSDQETVANAVSRVQDGGRLLRGEIGLRHFRTGASIPASCKIFVIQDPLTGEPASIACVAQNLSHIKRADAQLLHARQAFEDLLHHQSYGVALVNTQGRTIDSNQSFRRMLGYSADELREIPFSRFVHPDDLPLGRGLFLDLAEGKIDSYRIEKRLVDKQGNILPGRMTVRLMRDAQGQPSHTISIIERLISSANGSVHLDSPESYSGTCN